MNRSETEVQRTAFSRLECARSVGVAPQLVDSWMSREVDPLPSLRDGRRIIIPVKQLEEWLARQATTANQ